MSQTTQIAPEPKPWLTREAQWDRELDQSLDFILELADDDLSDLLVKAGAAADEITFADELDQWT